MRIKDPTASSEVEEEGEGVDECCEEGRRVFRPATTGMRCEKGATKAFRSATEWSGNKYAADGGSALFCCASPPSAVSSFSPSLAPSDGGEVGREECAELPAPANDKGRGQTRSE